MESSAFLGELMGTMVLVLLGDGVVANVSLNKTYGHGGGPIVITTAWAFAVTIGIFVSTLFGSADAHLNPAVTVAFAVSTGDWSKIATYVPAQLIGAFLGAVLVWLQYLPHWSATQEPATKLGCFATAPAIPNTAANFVSEVIGTVVLIVGVNSFSSVGQVATGFGPYLVGVLVWGIGLSLGGSTGYAINPARDLGPRLAHAVLPIAGKGPSNWDYAWLPVVAPLVGAVLAALLVK
jgi:glycerol uptake facilitator protein